VVDVGASVLGGFLSGGYNAYGGGSEGAGRSGRDCGRIGGVDGGEGLLEPLWAARQGGGRFRLGLKMIMLKKFDI